MRIADDGEIQFKGPTVFRGYWENPTATAEAFTADGWYRSGDIVRRRPDGNLVVEGRDKDMINRGGEKISAEEVENLAYQLPQVASAAAVSMPDATLGERVCLFAVLTPAVSLVLPAFRRFASRFIPIVYWGIGLMFVYNYLWAKAAKVIYQAAYVFDKISLTQTVQEIKESNYAIVFILVGWFAVWDLRHSKETGSVPVLGGGISAKPAYRD